MSTHAGARRLRAPVLGLRLALGFGLLLPGSALAQFARLSTSAGDGGVAIDLDAYGAFGYRTYNNGAGGPGDAIYDPVGAVGPSSTSWQSAVYFRLPGSSTFMTIGTVGPGTPTGNLPDPGFIAQTATVADSAFTFRGMDWRLRQSVSDLIVTGRREGTELLQEYVITNGSAATITFDLVRYYEGDLFLGLGAGVPDGGGRLVVGNEELVFETDMAGEPAQTTNLIGITACGGTTPARGRYEVNVWPAFPNRISADLPLGDVVYNDGIDPDEFVDAGLDYDVGIALANQFSLAPGQSALYVTTTVFGSLPPDNVSQGCAVRAQAVADAGPDQTACPGAAVTLDGSASFDADIVPGGGTVTWTWDLDVTVDSDGNGIPDDDVDATGPVVSSTFPVGTTTAQLTYTDDDGDVDTDTLTITVKDIVAPVVTCPAEVVVPATSTLGASVSPSATATDDCEPSPRIDNDRTPGGADATDDYPCGLTLVTFTALDAVGNPGTCSTLVRVVPDATAQVVGPALRVTKLADGRPVLDWSLVGSVPPELRFAVLRGELRAAPTAVAPGAGSLAVTSWTDDVRGGPLVFFDVRTVLCDGSLSAD